MMERRNFIKTATAAAGVMSLQSLKGLTHELDREDRLTPTLFIGHGSPMNGIEVNEFSTAWERLGAELPAPRAVLVVSAHWLTRGTHVTAMEQPKTIHDFGGFPQELYSVQYPAPGSPDLAEETKRLIASTEIGLDHEWGLDHGTWTIIRRMYPEANIPVLQLSIDITRPAQYHYDLAKQLAALRQRGVMIVGSGNMVHNLRMVAWDKLAEPEYGYDWAMEINDTFKRHISERNHEALVRYDSLGTAGKLAIPTPDHYLPLLYILALQQKQEEPRFFNDRAVGGSLTMTSVQFG